MIAPQLIATLIRLTNVPTAVPASIVQVVPNVHCPTPVIVRTPINLCFLSIVWEWTVVLGTGRVSPKIHVIVSKDTLEISVLITTMIFIAMEMESGTVRLVLAILVL